MSRYVAIGSLLLLLGMAIAAQAVTCTVASTGVAFGIYDTLSQANNDGLGTLSVTCTATTAGSVSYSVTLSRGNGSYSPRQLVSAGNTLNYNLYIDTTRLSVWGDGSAGTATNGNAYSLNALQGVTTNFTVFGRIPGGQAVRAGTYSDTLTATVTY